MRMSSAAQAQVNGSVQRRTSTSTSTASAIRHQQTTRQLATAADAYTIDDPIPFLTSLQSSIPQNSQYATPFSELRPWNASTLSIPEYQAQPTPRLPKTRQRSGGSAIELLQNLRASLVVGRWVRAASFIKKMGTMFTPNAPDLLEAHKIYLGALVDALSLGQSDVNAGMVQRWFEVEIRQAGTHVDADIMALMCRFCFTALENPTRDRTLRRYLQIAEEAGFLDETLASGTFLESEWEELISLREDIFDSPGIQAPQKAYIEEIVQSTREPMENAAAPELPQIRATDQRGLGLETLRKTLKVLRDPEEIRITTNAATEEEMDKEWARARQIQMEKDVSMASIERWKQEMDSMSKMGIKSNVSSKQIKTLMFEWYAILAKRIKKEITEIEALTASGKSVSPADSIRVEYGPYLASLKPEDTAAIVVSSIIEQMTIVSRGRTESAAPIHDGVSLSRVARAIGQRLAIESTGDKRAKFKRDAQITSSVKEYRKKMVAQLRKTEVVEKPWESSTGVPQQLEQFHWPSTVRLQLGAALVAKVLDTAKIDVKKDEGESSKSRREPAFGHKKIVVKGKRTGILSANAHLRDILAREAAPANIGARLPMLIEPDPWTGFRQGGYLRDPVAVVRAEKGDQIQELYARSAAEKGDLNQVMAGLTALGKTAWRVNRQVLTTMLEAWNTGEKFGKIPMADFKPEFPAEPASDASGKEKFMHKKQIQKLQDEASGLHSQRCFYNLQLEVARAFADETFYFPHNIDFRGRAYPIPPHFNHMGADNARGLLLFAKGKELGEEGLKWLKVHLANLAGYDKASLKEREEFADQHRDDIMDSAQNPINGKRWWMKTEDMWQLLAACYELSSAWSLSDPTKYVSHLAVHQDGTCNGLQHYAALGGDAIGAAQVNLEPGDRPSDVYTGVANLVKAQVEKDAADGDELAKALVGKITRKVVKQTVMTNVYGVTYIGARDQVLKQLDASMPNNALNFPMAGYIARNIFKSLGVMFTGAQAIQRWLGECADRITTAITKEQVAILVDPTSAPSLSELYPGYKPDFLRNWQKASNKKEQSGLPNNPFRSPVIWTTPLKLPVVQPYRQASSTQIPTVLQSITTKRSGSQDPVSRRKQLQGFPPNFIHSLDATHMLLSALRCDEMGLSFAAVHDSFWTHAADVPTMNHVLRDAFVRMHSENIIGRLADEFKARYGGGYCLNSTSPDSKLGKAIKAWRQQQRAKTGQRPAKIVVPVTKSLLPRSLDRRAPRDALYEELRIEAKRREQLGSDDEAARSEAEKTITPTTLYYQHGGLATLEAQDKTINVLGSLAETPSIEAKETDQEGEEESLFSEAESEEEADNSSEAEVTAQLDANDNPMKMTEESIAGAVQSEVEIATEKMKKVSPKKRVYFWAPLEFPDVPKKGDWDISRLRNSTYFFS